MYLVATIATVLLELTLSTATRPRRLQSVSRGTKKMPRDSLASITAVPQAQMTDAIPDEQVSVAQTACSDIIQRTQYSACLPGHLWQVEAAAVAPKCPISIPRISLDLSRLGIWESRVFVFNQEGARDVNWHCSVKVVQGSANEACMGQVNFPGGWIREMLCMHRYAATAICDSRRAPLAKHMHLS